MTRRHPKNTLVSDPNDTAPPTRPPCPAIPMTQRHPRDTPTSNPHGTAPPTQHAHQQSPWHSATHATRAPAIRMAQRHPRDTRTSNPHGTAQHTRHAHQQYPYHSGTHATRPPAIPMAQRHTRHTRDTPDAYPHSLPLRSTAQRRTRDTPDAACRCVPRNIRSKRTSTSPRIPCTCHDFAALNARTRTRTAEFSHRATKSSDFSYPARFPAPATQNDTQRRHRSHHSPRLPRETHAACTLRRPRESMFATPPVATFPHTSHVKRRRTNVQMHVSPHLPRGSTLQCLPERGHASAVPRLPRETHVRHARTQHADDTTTTPRRHRDDTERTHSKRREHGSSPQTPRL